MRTLGRAVAMVTVASLFAGCALIRSADGLGAPAIAIPAPEAGSTTFAAIPPEQALAIAGSLTAQDALDVAKAEGFVGTSPVVQLLEVTRVERGGPATTDVRWVIYSSDAMVPMVGPVDTPGGSVTVRTWVFVSPTGQFMGTVAHDDLKRLVPHAID